MDRVSELRSAGAGGSGDATLDTTSPPSDAFMSANETSSKYYSLSDTFDITPIKDVSLASTASDPDNSDLISNLSPIGKKDLDDFKIGRQIEAANILSGGVDIFDDNDNSFDGDELVIDDNVEIDDKSDQKDDEFKSEDGASQSTLAGAEETPSKDTEVVLQIDGKNVDAIDIGNGLYLYRKDGQEELAAVQIIDDGQSQPTFKFLKVRENAEGNLEVYEEIEIEIPKEVPTKEKAGSLQKKPSQIPITDNKVVNDSTITKIIEPKKVPQKLPTASTSEETEVKETLDKPEVNLNGKMVKFSESRKSPVVGSFTPMTYHSTPNKEGKPLTKTMVDLQLHPSRHSDNVKKTIEVHTDSTKQKPAESQTKKPLDPTKVNEIADTGDRPTEHNPATVKPIEEMESVEQMELKNDVKDSETEHKDISESIIGVHEEVTIKPMADQLLIDEDIESNETGILVIDEKQQPSLIESELEVMQSKEKQNFAEVPKETNIFRHSTKEIKETEDISLKGADKEVAEQSIEIPMTLNKPNLKENSEVIERDLKKSDKNESLVEMSSNKPASCLALSTKVDNNVVEPSSDSKMTTQEVKQVAQLTQSEEPSDKDSLPEKADKSVEAADEMKRIHVLKIKEVKSNEKLDITEPSLSNLGGVSNKTDVLQVAGNILEHKPNVSDNVSYIPKITKPILSEPKIEENKTRINIPVSVQSVQKTKLEENKPGINIPVSVQSVPKSFTEANKTEINTSASVQSVKKTIFEDNKTEINISASVQSVPKSLFEENKPGGNIASSVQSAQKPLFEKNKPEIPAFVQSVPKPKIEGNKTGFPVSVQSAPKRIFEETKTGIKIPSSVQSVPKPKIEQNKTGIPVPVQSVPKPIIQENKTDMNIPVQIVPKPKIEGNKSRIIMPVTVQSIQKPIPIKTSDSKVIAKSEPVTKGITANKQGAVVDKKLSSAELSKTVEFKIKPDISQAVEPKDKKDLIIAKLNPDVKPINNNHTAVPFGKWTEVNRQEFLNKFKEHKAPINTNSKQIKNSNDLNRRDVLKKIDSQRQSNIASSKDKPPPAVKNETLFSNKVPSTKADTTIVVKNDAIEVKPKLVESVSTITKQEIPQNPAKPVASCTVSSSTTAAKATKKELSAQNEPIAVYSAVPSVSKLEHPRREVNIAEPLHREVNVKSLINKTIEDMLSKVTSFPPLPKAVQDEAKQFDKKDQVAVKVENKSTDLKKKQTHANKQIKIIDDIEIKMNELHGIPFVERPAHQLPKVNQQDVKASSTLDLENTLSKNLKATKNEVINKKMETIEVDSEEEVIEHEPITGDIELNNKFSIKKMSSQDVNAKINVNPTIRIEDAKKETVITEKEFDKFARRNSVTYDNCVTVNLEAKESQNDPSNVKGRETLSTINPKKELIHLEPKSNLHPIRPHNTYSRKPLSNAPVPGDPHSKNYQSKIHIAYQSVLTSKMDRQISHPVERPITIIEDKPVKVVFMDANAEFVPGQLNVQGKELSPAKHPAIKQDASTVSTTESVDKPQHIPDIKQSDDTKTKTKHQRKQVLTPVDTPELELIQPGDIGIEVSPKKKRKVEDYKADKYYKNLTHKKSYLLGRSTMTEEIANSELSQTSSNNEKKIEESKIVNVNTATALDNLVKAAELIENQDSMNTCSTPSSDSPQNTPMKRGRGRPRKYPLLGSTPTNDTKVSIPQKKPQLIDARPVKDDSLSDDEISDGEIVKENWTMGKINENIVCPICNKLFRSENVVFKHVKHCTGESPNRSESDKTSPRRDRESKESDIKSLDSRSDDMDIDSDEKLSETKKRTPKKRKSRDPIAKSETDSPEIIVIEDTPAKQKPENVNKTADEQQKGIKMVAKTKVPQKLNNLVCEFCGKTFRQLSYLVSHRLQHKRDEEKKREKDKDGEVSNKSQVFSCEVCKKEFRKLHHLVQHRIIHNPNTMPSRNTRKTSAEHIEIKSTSKDDTSAKQSDDSSAAFRCEPCDKSFRKLHHLVEHRETHDGINRQKVSASTATVLEKPPPPPQCDVCKKTFRKLHHLIEHKEQHAETSSEKSDDKSVKSALSTKDIIHECPLCYMVFPNEHSLNKHSGICQRKKRQSKPVKNIVDENNEVKTDENLVTNDDKNIEDNGPTNVAVEVIDETDNIVESKEHQESKEIPNMIVTKPENDESTSTEVETKDKVPLMDIQDKDKENDTIVIQAPTSVIQKDEIEKETETYQKETVTIVDKVKKVEEKHVNKNPAVRKNTAMKNKVAPTVTKRRRTADATLPIITEPKPAQESSDDDEIRYMFNPNFKVEETNEGKVFLKVRANKRNSLQIERPNSKDLVTRRTSLQHPPKIPRLKAKPIEPKTVPTSQTILKIVPKIPKIETAPSTDSDDSDVKYSFPKNVPEKAEKPVQEVEKKPGRKSLADKRKSLSGIAKRKSVGQSVAAKNKHRPSPLVQPLKKRTREVEHRCDCGQLFSSAALLSRHTSLAHTPPRIRRRRSPPPEPSSKPAKKTSVKATTPTTSKPAASSRKSIKPVAPSDARKSVKPDNSTAQSSTKLRRSAPAHAGVPVPEKMRKLMLKNKK